MSWTRIYRLALRLLPVALRQKHGAAMEALFARELGRASARGPVHGALAGTAGVWDVLLRGAYEHLRLGRSTAGELRDRLAADRWNIDAHRSQPPGANIGGPLMPQLTTRQVLRRHAISFIWAFVALTASLLALYAIRQVPALRARNAPAGTIAEALLLALPFTAALTIPMAVLVSVLHEFTRFGADGTLASVMQERAGSRRLIVPVLAAAAVMAVLSLVMITEIVPRTNARLSAVLVGHSGPKSEREMTIGELRAAVSEARPGIGEYDLRRATRYEVEFQKKLALPASCLVMAIIGVALALRIPRGGALLVIGASCMVFGAYYTLLVMGEGLADRLIVSPLVAMWGANAFLLLVALLAVSGRRASAGPPRRRTVAIHG